MSIWCPVHAIITPLSVHNDGGTQTLLTPNDEHTLRMPKWTMKVKGKFLCQRFKAIGALKLFYSKSSIAIFNMGLVYAATATFENVLWVYFKEQTIIVFPILNTFRDVLISRDTTTYDQSWYGRKFFSLTNKVKCYGQLSADVSCYMALNCTHTTQLAQLKAEMSEDFHK